jgi:hypothetical protein
VTCWPDARTRPIRGPVLEGDDVPKKQAAKAGTVRPATSGSSTQPNAITIRGSAEWKQWLERFAAKMRVKPTAIIDLALAKLAERERFAEPPPRI